MRYFSLITLIFITLNLSACSDYELEDYGAVGPERKCSDGIDNDGDGKTDCDDSDCATAANCNGGDPETNCTDQIDNDNDGAVDCADADCNDAPACQPEPKCGNNVLEEGEGCDGQDFGERTCVSYNFTGGELTCTSNCLVSVASCSNTAEPICGNGIQESGEQCDRNDFTAGDSCVSRGFDYGSLSCTNACRVSTANCEYEGPECGDGVCEGDEENTCPADCASDPVCGNGIMETGEGCDGNDFNGRTCSFYGYDSGSLDCRTNCTISAAGCFNSSNPENCSNGADDDGDGFVDCDDADCWDDYACHCGNGYCESDYNETASTCPADCTNTVVCGNGVKESGEVCDGNAFGGLTCASYGFNAGTLSCTNSCGTISTSNCYNPNTIVCGNGVKEGSEVCDGNAFGGLTCSSYGFTNGTLSCTNSCGSISTANCYNPNTIVCGNGVKESGEVCDGNAFGGLTCVSYGFDYGSLLCTNSCGTISTVNCYDINSSSCGNGILESGEQCDSNAFPSGLSCASYGFSSGSLSCGTGCTISTTNCYNPSTYYCGNGVLNSGEGCDGNLFGGKTCSTFGFSGGSLACNYNCTVNTTGCNLAGGEICNNGIDDDGDGFIDCADSDCRWKAACTYLTVRKRTTTGVTYFGCDGTNNASWEPVQCSGTGLMFNGAINGRYMFAYLTAQCSPQAILDYGISWEAFEFLAYSTWSSSFGNMACYVGCSINPQTNLQEQANAVCIVDKTNPAHQAERNAYMPGGKWLEVHPGSIASYLYWY